MPVRLLNDFMTMRRNPSEDHRGRCQREHSLLEITRRCWLRNAGHQRSKYDALVDYGRSGRDFYWRGVASIYGIMKRHRRQSMIWCCDLR